MGSLPGHLVPGSMFIVIALWWFIGEILHQRQLRIRAGSQARTQRSNSIQTLWYPCPCPKLSQFPFEPLVRVMMVVIGVIIELGWSKATTMFDENGAFIESHFANYAHSLMYCFFGLSAVVDLLLFYNVIPLPPRFDYFILSVALWIEGFLFYVHLHGRTELSVRLHTILFVVIFITAAVFLLAVISDQLFAYMGFLRAYLASLQGCWFYQVGFVLFGPRPWKNAPGNVEFVGIAFAFHVFVLLVVHLIGHAVCYRIFIKRRRHHGEIMDSQSSSEEMSLIMHQSS